MQDTEKVKCFTREKLNLIEEWCPEMGLNHRPRALQAHALPLSYLGNI